jgi:predicted porin
MKKILLGTTTLVGAALLSQAALAGAPKVTVGGFSEVQVGVMSDDQDANQRNHAFRNDNEISFKVDGKSDAGLGYGAEIWLEADVTDDADNQGEQASKTFIYLEGSWGRLEAGSTLGADQTLKIDAASIARATGGIDGDFTYFINQDSSLTGVNVIATPDLPVNYGFVPGAAPFLGDESQENLTKLVYYTPKWNGFQAGLSYSPDSTDRGQTVTLSDADSTESDAIWQAGVSYTGTWDKVGFGLAATAERGDAENPLRERDGTLWRTSSIR